MMLIKIFNILILSILIVIVGCETIEVTDEEGLQVENSTEIEVVSGRVDENITVESDEEGSLSMEVGTAEYDETTATLTITIPSTDGGEDTIIKITDHETIAEHEGEGFYPNNIVIAGSTLDLSYEHGQFQLIKTIGSNESVIIIDEEGGENYYCEHEDYIPIISVQFLQNLYPDFNYCLLTDLDLSSVEFLPIGYPARDITDNDNTIIKFNGILDGNNKTINGLTINKSNANFIGLFGEIGMTAKIKNLNLSNININGKKFVGALTAINNGNIENVSINGIINGGSFVGGITGLNRGTSTIKRSDTNITITATNSQSGGIAGHTEKNTKIINSFATGDIVGVKQVGGLIGYNDGELSNSYATGKVEDINQDTSLVQGGLVGFNFGAINNSYFDINTTNLINGVGKNGKGNENVLTIEGINSSVIIDGGSKPFIDNNWDFDIIWSSQGNGKWPILK